MSILSVRTLFVVVLSASLILPQFALTASKESEAASKRVKKLISDIEDGKYGDDLTVNAKIHEESEKLFTYLGENPSDADAVLVLMQLYEISQRVSWVEMPKPSEVPENLGPNGTYIVFREKKTAPYHRVIDGALESNPSHAGLHAWKGRLYSLYEPLRLADGLDTLHTQLPQAIDQLQQAVVLAPKDETYHEWLAAMFLAAGREQDALAEYRPLNGGKHPGYLLLNDWELLGVPEGWTRDRDFESTVVEMMKSSGVDFAPARFRCFVFPGSASDLESVCKRQWPGFRLLANPDASSTDVGASFAQYLLLRDGAFRGAADAYDKIPEEPSKGIGITVTEQRASDDVNAKNPALTGIDVYCLVIAQNYRDMDWR